MGKNEYENSETALNNRLHRRAVRENTVKVGRDAMQLLPYLQGKDVISVSTLENLLVKAKSAKGREAFLVIRELHNALYKLILDECVEESGERNTKSWAIKLKVIK